MTTTMPDVAKAQLSAQLRAHTASLQTLLRSCRSALFQEVDLIAELLSTTPTEVDAWLEGESFPSFDQRARLGLLYYAILVNQWSRGDRDHLPTWIRQEARPELGFSSVFRILRLGGLDDVELHLNALLAAEATE